MCKCFGFFKYEETKFDMNELHNFGEGDIKILYRDKIKVFYVKV